MRVLALFNLAIESLPVSKQQGLLHYLTFREFISSIFSISYLIRSSSVIF